MQTKKILKIFNYIYFTLFVLFNSQLFAKPLLEYSKEEGQLAEKFIEDRQLFHEYIKQNRGLRSALNLLQNGSKTYFQGYDIHEASDKTEGRAKVIYEYLKTTKSVVLFTSGFHSVANAYFQQGRQVVVGKYEGKDVKSFHNNIIWISDRYKSSPAMVALLISHEVGHGLYNEYKSNKGVFPGEFDPATDQGEFCEKILEEKCVEEFFAYAREGAVAEELRLFDILNNLVSITVYNSFTERAKSRFHELFGEIDPAQFETLKAQINYRTEVRRCYSGYALKTRRCGMPCKHFNTYKYCDNKVLFPPCHLWKEHLESLEQ